MVEKSRQKESSTPRSGGAGPVEWIEEIRDRIVAEFQPMRLILFGSMARNEAGRHSDVDLLVVLPRADNKRQVTVEIQSCLAGLPVSRDIVVTTPEEIERRGRVVGTLLYSALREGKVIYDMSNSEHIAEGERWLQFAREDLTTAEALAGQTALKPRHACWLAQQAAEKGLKGALIFLQIEPPRSHDLDALRDLLPEGWRVKAEFPDLSALKEWAVEARYPGEWAEASSDDANTAVHQAGAFLSALTAELGDHGMEIVQPA